MATTKAVFLVYSGRGQWWVDFEGHGTGPFVTRPVAIIEATSLARQMQQSGRPSEVLAPGDDNRHHVAWPNPARQRPEPALAD
jgi:hypothetical protein